jgi:hypothetical protein
MIRPCFGIKCLGFGSPAPNQVSGFGDQLFNIEIVAPHLAYFKDFDAPAF